MSNPNEAIAFLPVVLRETGAPSLSLKQSANGRPHISQNP